MIEINVVLPHPEGPTKSVISPAGISRSIPRSALTAESPSPNSFVTPRHFTTGPDASDEGRGAREEGRAEITDCPKLVDQVALIDGQLLPNTFIARPPSLIT
jgi:hypothetical protein